MDAWREYSSSFRNERYRGKSCSMSTRWFKVAYPMNWTVIATCATCTTRWPMVLCWCGLCRSCFRKISGHELGKERAEKVLASLISLDERKEWTCKFCSESNVWTRWRYRRCYHDIPAGLRGKHRHAARAGEWSTGSSTSSGKEDRKSKKLEAGNK